MELFARVWVEAAERPGTHWVTKPGNTLRDVVEQLTDNHFYAPGQASPSRKT